MGSSILKRVQFHYLAFKQGCNLNAFCLKQGQNRRVSAAQPQLCCAAETLKKEINRVRSIPRQETLKARPQNKKSNGTPFVITHNPALPNVSTTVRKNINILQSSNRCKQTFPSPPIVAYKRNPILRELLVRSTLHDSSIQEKPSLGVLKCNHPRCLTCSFLKQGQSHPTRLTSTRETRYITP